METFARSIRLAARFSIIGAMALGTAVAWAWEAGGTDGSQWRHHSTLPVPAALIFGGIAVSAAAAAARRRKGKDGAQSQTDGKLPGADK